MGSGDPRDQGAVDDLGGAGAGDDRAADGVRQPDRHLEVAGVGGVVAEQHQVVGVAVGLGVGDDRGDLGGHVGRAEGDRVGLHEHAGVRAEREGTSDLLDRLGDPDADDRDGAAGGLGDLDGQLDGAGVVVTDRVAGVPAVEPLLVGGEGGLPGGVDDPLDGHEDAGPWGAHARTRSLSGSKTAVESALSTVTG